MTLSRRTFIKTSLLGAIALAAAGGLYRATKSSASADAFALDGESKAALGAIIAVMLKDAIPATAEGIEAAVVRVQTAIAGLPLMTQKEIQDLFGLLVLGPTRYFLAGVPDQWSKSRSKDVAAFLQSWRMHRFAMLQTAYHALHDLIIGGWYADESTWASIGYPGPMKALS